MAYHTDYNHSMDREYGMTSGYTSEDGSATGDVGYSIKDIGFSVPFGLAANNVSGVAAKIKTGARSMELQFFGTGRSQRGAQTPELYGKPQRQALAELAKATEVEFTTHASGGVMGLAGMGERGFSKEAQRMAVDEVNRAVDFAADVAKGGTVVVHVGEFNRPFSESEWNKKGPWAGKFRKYEDEEKEAHFMIVDDRTGQVLKSVPKETNVPLPLWNTAKPGQEYFEDGKKKIAKEGEEVFLDYLGNKVLEEERVPLFDEKTKQFKVEMRSWNHFEKEAEKLTKQAREFWKNKQAGKETKDWEETPWLRFKQVDSEKDIHIKPEEAFFIADAELQEAVHRGTSVRYGGQFDEMIERMGKMKKAREFYKKVESTTDEEERWKLERQVPFDAQGLVPPGTKMPTQLLDKEIKHLEEEMLRTREQIVAQEVKIKQFKEAIGHIENAEDYALKQSYKGYAEIGLKAYEQSQKLKKMGEKGAKDLFIGMEHIFPEQYGGHPDELITLVENSRKRMAQELVQRKGLGESQAKELAERHIKAHLDTGHINIWRKYWVADPNKSPEKNNEEFDQWLLEKVESMAKKKIIGSVHLSDNFGYQDEHLTPGEGNTPIRKIAEILKKNGYNHPLIVEPGAAATTDLSDFHGLMKTWKLFGSSIYGAAPTGGKMQKKQWGQVQYGYFGQAESPYFVFGGYSPSEDFTLWSGVGME